MNSECHYFLTLLSIISWNRIWKYFSLFLRLHMGSNNAWHSPLIAWITHRNGTDRKNWGKLKFQWIFTPWVNIYWIFNFRRFFSDSVERGPRKTILENSRGTVALKHFSFIFVYIAFYPFSQYKLSNFYVEAPFKNSGIERMKGCTIESNTYLFSAGSLLYNQIDLEVTVLYTICIYNLFSLGEKSFCEYVFAFTILLSLSFLASRE